MKNHHRPIIHVIAKRSTPRFLPSQRLWDALEILLCATNINDISTTSVLNTHRAIAAVQASYQSNRPSFLWTDRNHTVYTLYRKRDETISNSSTSVWVANQIQKNTIRIGLDWSRYSTGIRGRQTAWLFRLEKFTPQEVSFQVFVVFIEQLMQLKRREKTGPKGRRIKRAYSAAIQYNNNSNKVS